MAAHPAAFPRPSSGVLSQWVNLPAPHSPAVSWQPSNDSHMVILSRDRLLHPAQYVHQPLPEACPLPQACQPAPSTVRNWRKEHERIWGPCHLSLTSSWLPSDCRESSSSLANCQTPWCPKASKAALRPQFPLAKHLWCLESLGCLTAPSSPQNLKFFPKICLNYGPFMKHSC